MSKLQMLRAFVNQRLSSAVEEIFVLFERTITEYEDEVSRSKEENERQRKLLDAVLSPEVRLHRADMQQLLVQQEWSFSVKQEDPEPPHIKEEQEELWSLQEGEQLQGLEEADITEFSSTLVPVKSESDEEGAQFSHLNQSQTEENREAEPPASSTSEHMKTESDEEDCGGQEPDRNVDPADVQQLLVQQEWSFNVKQEDPESPHMKEEQEEPWSYQEGEQLQGLEEVDMQIYDVQQLLVQQEWSSNVKQEDPESPHIKEEQEELWHHQDGQQLQGLEEVDISKFSFIPVPVKSESDEEEAQSSHLHQSQTEENRETEPPASSSAEHMKTESDEEDCEEPEQARKLDPTCEDKDSGSSEFETNENDGWREIREPQSGLKTLKNKCDNEKKPVVCSTCDKRFVSKSALTTHMRSHTGERPFICSVCGKGLAVKKDLTIHMRIHSGEKPFMCSICGKRFTRKTHLTVHMRIHSGEKPFSCTVCGKEFSQKHTFTVHMRIHSAEKPFSCIVCGKRFTYKCGLTVHMRVHSGERPFRCTVCGKEFTQKNCITAHMRVHTGEKPFRCTDCGKGFTQKHNLTAHMRVHSQKKPTNVQFVVKDLRRNTP